MAIAESKGEAQGEKLCSNSLFNPYKCIFYVRVLYDQQYVFTNKKKIIFNILLFPYLTLGQIVVIACFFLPVQILTLFCCKKNKIKMNTIIEYIRIFMSHCS